MVAIGITLPRRYALQALSPYCQTLSTCRLLRRVFNIRAVQNEVLGSITTRASSIFLKLQRITVSSLPSHILNFHIIIRTWWSCISEEVQSWRPNIKYPPEYGNRLPTLPHLPPNGTAGSCASGRPLFSLFCFLSFSSYCQHTTKA